MVAYAIPLIFATSLYAHSVHAAYLTTETRALPTTGAEVQTSRALDAAQRYGITIASSYTLRPLLPERCPETTSPTHCPPRVRFNGALLPAGSELHADERPHFYDSQKTPRGYYVPELRFFVWGDGKPLAIRMDGDFSQVIQSATVSVIDLAWHKAERDTRIRQVLEKLNHEREEHEQQEAERPFVEHPSPLIFGGVIATLLAGLGVHRLFSRRRPDPESPQRTPRYPFILPQLVEAAPAHTHSSEKRPESPPCPGTVTAHRPEPPAVRVPQYPRPPEPSSPLSRFFDPYSRIEAHHDRERFTATIEAETCLHKMDVEQATTEKKIQQEAAKRVYQHQADIWLRVNKFENQAMGEVAKHQKFQELIDSIAIDIRDPTLRAALIERITKLYLNDSPQKEE